MTLVTRHILKVQLPIVTSNTRPELLVYNRSRTIETMLPVTPELAAKLQNKLKSFWYGHVEGKVLHLERPAPWQEW